MSLSAQDQAAAHRAYPRVLEALNGLSTEAAFALMGSVFSFILEDTEKAVAHKAVDNFAETAHELIGGKH